MKSFRDVSIRNKLVGIILIVTSVAVGAGFAVDALRTRTTFRRNLVRNTALRATLIGEYSVVPLSFGDRQEATLVLARLEAIPSVESGLLFDSNGDLFTAYRGSGDPVALRLQGLAEPAVFEAGVLHTYQPIIYQGRVYGAVYLRTSTSDLDRAIRGEFLVAVLLGLVLIGVSYALALGLQGLISKPILELAKVTKRISEHGDYSLRVERHGRDEIGALYDGFNAMLERLEVSEEERARFEVRLRHQQKLEAMGTLAGGVAHEINNPIQGIMNYASLIHERLEPDSPLREFAGEIGRESERVAGIVRNLLAFARQEKESHSPANIYDIVNDTLTLIRTIIRRDQITLEVDVPADLPMIKCRSQQIQQILMNLLTNARDALNARYPEYDPDKIIKVTVLGFERDGRPWLRTTVEDHGAGITDEDLGKVFDPFFTTKGRAEGTGLGLSISHGMVQDHGGEISIECEQGRYTRFHVDLPVDNGWSPIEGLADDAPNEAG